MRWFSLFVVLGTLVVSCAKDPVTSGGSGGTTGTGGTVGTGGKVGTGGAPGSGGKTGTGGATGTGGTSQPGSIDCTDVSTDTYSIKDQYGSTQITLDNNPKKTYYMMANWWGTPYNNQTETINGLGFTMANPSSTPSSNPSNPLGFPSIFIGTYQTRGTQGSGLPKQVSSLTSVPTIFSTNADTKGTSNYNATYDVWFTQTNALVSGTDPGAGGAFLMVWLFSPSDRRPRGSIKAGGTVVSGVKGGWDVWVDSSNSPRPCLSYVSNTTLSSLEFDLNYFIQDAVQNNYGIITSSQYLSIIFAGFEVWGGGDGLQVKKFCANVK
jgi:cellulose 1,4-beta-cellobiosidase